jgi:hypothetical protein
MVSTASHSCGVPPGMGAPVNRYGAFRTTSGRYT